MKNESKADVILRAADSTGKWGVVCLVLGIVMASIGVLIGATQIVCGVMLMKKQKELSDVA